MSAGGGAVSFRHPVVLAFGGFFHLPRKLLDALPHDFARLEFDRGARGNHETASGLIGIPSDARLGQTRLKDSEVAQFDGHVPRQTVRDLVQSPLDHIEDLMLYHPRLIADGHDDVAFCELTHGVTDSSADAFLSG